MSPRTQRALVQFKFYRHAIRFNPYDGSTRGHKGGAGPKNLGEFQRCINDLHSRRSADGIAKYVVLVYADPTAGNRRRFSESYDDYRHPLVEPQLTKLLAMGPTPTRDGSIAVRGAVYRVGGTVPVNPA